MAYWQRRNLVPIYNYYFSLVNVVPKRIISQHFGFLGQTTFLLKKKPITVKIMNFKKILIFFSNNELDVGASSLIIIKIGKPVSRQIAMCLMH